MSGTKLESKSTGELFNEVNAKHYSRNSSIRFEDRYRRLTTYVENELFYDVQSLRERGIIHNITAFINEAIKTEVQKYI